MPPVETYILPDLGWSSLLLVIAREARPGAVIAVCTVAMQQLAEQTLDELGRRDVQVELRPNLFP